MTTQLYQLMTNFDEVNTFRPQKQKHKRQFLAGPGFRCRCLCESSYPWTASDFPPPVTG